VAGEVCPSPAVAVMATAVVAVKRVAATQSEPTFERRRHLLFAALALAHGPLTREIGPAILWLVGARVWSAELVAAEAMSQLGFAALVAWLAFWAFDTGSGVTLLPRRWRDAGGMFVAWFVVLECFSLWIVLQDPGLHWQRSAGWLEVFTGDLGKLRLGWLAACLLAYPIAEEIVYRGLLQRALEGYTRGSVAVIAQAVVFELVHAYVYGYGLTGVWFVIGYFLGVAFQRTRSLAVPILLHTAHNALYFASVWLLNHV
jgi:uncharacterized protein